MNDLAVFIKEHREKSFKTFLLNDFKNKNCTVDLFVIML